MAWFGESLSSFTGHLQNLTKEVLSEASDDTKDAAGNLKATKEKLEELEATCTAQDLEISALKKQNAELRRRLEEAGCLEDEGQFVLPAAPTTWLKIEQRCDAGYAGAHTGGSNHGTTKGHTRALSDATALSAKHQERLEKELNERIQLIEHLQMQLQKVEEERHVLSLRTSHLEQQVQELSQNSIIEKSEREKISSLGEDKYVQENHELRSLLNDANTRIFELEEELLNIRNECLDHVIDSQTHETEQTVNRLQIEDETLAAEMASKIQKLGDQEHQDLIHGTFKALELENRVLNMRNAQLERESLKDTEMKIDDGKSFTDVESRIKSNEMTKYEDDVDNLSYQSELSELSASQRFENQITQLQNQVEMYKREMKHNEMLRDNLSSEKLELEAQVYYLKDKLEKQQKSLDATSSQDLITPIVSHEQEKSRSNESIEKVKELEQELDTSKETMELLCDEKECLGQELKAMARVVQDLEAKVAASEEEKSELLASIDELDQQHQDALVKLLGLRNADLVEKEMLKSQVMNLESSILERPQMDESCVQTEDLFLVHSEGATQTECIHQYNQESQADVVNHDKETCTDVSEVKIINEDTGSYKFDKELSEKIKRLINFDIPNDFNNTIPQSLYLVQQIVKIVNDCKWKKDTLERKVAELIRENKEYKSTITILEAECSNLKDNVERLAEQLVGVAKSSKDPLPTILENCEEIEMFEQKTAMLEEEIAVLRETRVNLEEDALRMREERHDLLGKIRNLEAHQKNQENLQTELQRLADDATNSARSYEAAVELAENARTKAENKAKSLAHELEACVLNYEKQLSDVTEFANNLDLKNKELLQDVMSKEAKLDEYQSNISELEVEKHSLIAQLQQKSQNLGEIEKVIEDRRMLQRQVSNLQRQLHDSDELRAKIERMSEDMELSINAKLDLEDRLITTTRTLQDAQLLIKNLKEMQVEVTKWQNTAASEELKVKDALVSVFKLEEEKKILQEKLMKEEFSAKSLAQKVEHQVKEIEELKDKLHKELSEVHNGHLKGVSLEEVQSEIIILQNQKLHLEQALSTTLQEQNGLKKEVENLRSHVLLKEQTEAQLHQTVSALTIEANDLEVTLQEKYKAEFAELVSKLEQENQKLNSKLTAIERNGESGIEESEKVKSLDSQLHIVLREKENLLEENTRLKAAAPDHNKQNYISEDTTLLNNILPISMHSVESDYVNIVEIKQLSEEKQRLLVSLEKKVQEVDTLQAELKDMSSIVDQNKDVIKQLEKQRQTAINENSQNQEKFQMTKETVSRLSEIIKEKDVELSDLKTQLSHLTTIAQRSDSINQQLLQAQESIVQLIQERDQLLQTVHVKHQESVQYHSEIQRLSSLLGQEMTKNQQLASQYASLVHQCNEEKANSSPKHEQEVKQLQDLMKVKDEGLQQLCKRMELKEQELQARGMEMEMLQHHMEMMAQEKAASTSGHQVEEIQEKYKEVLSKFHDEQRKGKNLQNELELCQGRELALQRELDRLRIHLVEIEDTYTQEALKSEEHVKELTNKLLQAEEMMKSSSTVYKSANIRANQQVETFQEQARLIAQQRDDVQIKLSAAEDQVAKHSAALCNLQAVLEQFQRDREREIEAARATVYIKVEAAQKRHEELLKEISSLKLQLREAKEGLSAASRLGEELEKKTEVVNRLKQEVMQLEEKVQTAEEKAKVVGQTVEGKVDKSLVKNVVLGFFLAPSNSKEQVLHVVASVLDFSEDEKSRIQKRLGLHGAVGSGGWFKGLLHPATQEQGSSQSLSEAFVRFLENESIPQPRLKMLPDTEKHASSSSNSPRATTPVTTQRKSPLLLADVQLPTFAQFPVGRNSSSILKDILKES